MGEESKPEVPEVKKPEVKKVCCHLIYFVSVVSKILINGQTGSNLATLYNSINLVGDISYNSLIRLFLLLRGGGLGGTSSFTQNHWLCCGRRTCG